MTDNTAIRTILQSLVERLQYSSDAYRDYLAYGKTFRFARQLKQQNDAALQLLQINRAKFQEPLRSDIDALIHHYEVWTEKWLALAEDLQPANDDLFVFENSVTFPREAAARLAAECRR